MLRYLFSYILILVSLSNNAQVQMADDFRGEGKIYVVLAIIITILAGFFYLLFKLDNRTKRLEREVKNK